MDTNTKIRWFLAGVFSTVSLLLAAYFVLIAPLERSIEVSMEKIAAQRDTAMAENAKLRQQLQVVDRQHNFTLSFPSPVAQ